jgi:asparagine synthase (glutamine-hydrolysing)
MYYGRQGRGRDSAFLFGSELKALACHPAFEGEIDRDGLSGFMHGGYVPGPRSIYRNIFKLTPGCILTLDGSGEPRVEPYWSLAEVIRQGTLKPDLLREEEVVDELESVLGRAVAGQLIGDVPLGAFLSGGIDAASIVGAGADFHDRLRRPPFRRGALCP